MEGEPNVHWFHITYPISGASFGGSCLHRVQASGYGKAVEKLFTKMMSEVNSVRWNQKRFAPWIEKHAEENGYVDAHECFVDGMTREASWMRFGDIVVTPIHDDTVVRY